MENTPVSAPQTAFDDAFDHIKTTVDFNPDWTYPTGAMHRAAWAKFDRVSKFIDDRGRRCIGIPLPVSLDGRHHTLVVYEQKFFQKGVFGSDGLHTVGFSDTLEPPSLVLLLDLVRDGKLGPESLRAMEEIAGTRGPNKDYFMRQMVEQFTQLGWLQPSA